MPLSDFTPEEIAEMQSKGIDPNTAVLQQPDPISKVETVKRQLIAHGGGLVGGSAAIPGAIYGGTLGSIGGPIGTAAGAIIGGTITGLGGSYAGQKIQEAVTPEQVYAAQQLAAQQASEQNPKTAFTTDLIASALTSGGRPSRDVFRAGEGLIGKLAGKELTLEAQQALVNTLTQSAVNPAIATGVSLAQGQGIPSIDDLAAQAGGGAIFAKSWVPHGGRVELNATKPELAVPIPSKTDSFSEPKQEVNNSSKVDTQSLIGKINFESGLNERSIDDNSWDITKLAKSPDYKPEIVQEIIDKKVTKPVAVQRIFPELNLNDQQAADLLNQANVIRDKNSVETPAEIMLKQAQNNNQVLKDSAEVIRSKAKTKDILPTVEEANSQLEDSGDIMSAIPPENKRPKYIGVQENFRDKSKPIYLYNLQEPIIDSTGKVISGVDSTVSKANLEKYGVPHDEPPDIKNAPGVGDGDIKIPIALQAHIRNNNATTGSILHSLSTTPDHPFQPLAKALIDIADKNSLQVKWNHNKLLDNGSERSHYNQRNDEVNIGTQSSSDARIVMEEAIHSLTSKKMPEFAGQGEEHFNRLQTYVNKPDANPHVKDLIKSYFQTAYHLGVNKDLFKDTSDFVGLAGNPDAAIKSISGIGHTTKYALGNLHEFIAQAIKDPEFQKVLNNIKTTDGRTVMQKIVDAVRNLLGLKGEAGTMLDRVLRSSGELVKQERPGKTASEHFDNPNINTIPSEEVKVSTDEKPIEPKVGLIPRLTGKLQATNDKVRAKFPVLGEAFDRFAERREQLVAPKTTTLVDLGKYDAHLVDKVYEAHREAYRSGTEPLLKTVKEKEISRLISNYYGKIADIRREYGIEVNGREGGKNPYYVPDQLSSDAIKIFTEHSSGPTASYYKRIWADHVVKETDGGISKETALKNINEYISALGSSNANYNSAKFGAIRKAAGYGLPDGMRETDAMKSIDRYGNRAATDMAMYKELESNPQIASLLKLRDPVTGSIPEHNGELPDASQDNDVRNAMKWVTGNFSNVSHPTMTAVVRAVNNGILGLSTGIRDLVQIPVNMLPYINHIGDIGHILKGISQVRENARASLETGATKPNIDKIRFNELNDSSDRFISSAQKLGDILRRYQGREALENFSRDVTFSIGKALTTARVLEAANGNAKSLAWLKRFGLLVDEDITKISGEKLQAAINQTAKNFVTANQGSYDARGIPTGMVDSHLAPFMSLQKWSVEKANTIYKDVYKPFVSGENRLPLLTYTLGTIFTGAGIQELNKLLNNRKSQDPEIAESLQAGTPHAIASQLAALMSLSSFGGIVGDSLKAVSDLSNKKAPRNPLSFPLATASSDLISRTSNVIEAINSGEEPLAVLGQFALDLTTKNIQTARMVANRTINSDNVENSDKFRDLRVFNELEGDTKSNITTTNPYLNISVKDFKHAKDPQEAMAMLPAIINHIVTKSDGDVYKMKRELDNLKSNSYQTIPNMQSAPSSFVRYINFLQQTQGADAANARLMDYLTQNAVNHAKSSVVP